ncbi:hypothetical protein Agub_g4000, partial [Astrephomene gubernaculifera]
IANGDFNGRAILAWMLTAAVQSAILLVVALMGTSGTTAAGAHGMPYGMAEIGVVLFTAVILTVHLQLALVVEAWTWVHFAAVWGSVASWYIYLLGFGCFPVSWSLELWNLFSGVVAPSPQFWLFSLLATAAAVLPVAGAMSLKRLLWPSDEDLLREIGSVRQQQQQQQQKQQQQQQERPKKLFIPLRKHPREAANPAVDAAGTIKPTQHDTSLLQQPAPAAAAAAAKLPPISKHPQGAKRTSSPTIQLQQLPQPNYPQLRHQASSHRPSSAGSSNRVAPEPSSAPTTSSSTPATSPSSIAMSGLPAPYTSSATHVSSNQNPSNHLRTATSDAISLSAVAYTQSPATTVSSLAADSLLATSSFTPSAAAVAEAEALGPAGNSTG